MNTEQKKVTDSRNVAGDIREKQDRVIAICERRGFPMDAPISDLQYGAPTAQELKACIYPAFSASIDSFLSNFDKS